MPQLQNLPFKSAFFAWVFTSFLFLSGDALSQGTSSNAAGDTTKTTKVIEPIQVSNIGTATENTLSVIREIRSKMNPSKPEVELDSLIPEKLELVEVYKKDINLEEIQEMNLRQTESLKNDINQLRVQLDDWRSTLTNRIEDFNEMKVQLLDLRTQWEKTIELDREEKLLKEITDRIRTNLSEVNSQNIELVKRYNELLKRQDDLTGALIYLDEVLNAISKTEQSLRTQIFTIDSPPIWQMFNLDADTVLVGVKEDTLSFANKINIIIEDHNKDFVVFTENYKSNIYFHILFFVILFFLIFYLKNDVARWSDEKKDDAILSSLHIITRPFTAALLVTLLLSRVFYGEAPDDVLNYYYALLMWPILTIVPGLIPAIPKKYFYFVGVVFLVSQIADYFSDLVVLDRSLSMMLDVITIVLLISLLKSGKLIRESGSNLKWGFTFTIMRITVFLLIVAVAANILGNTVLSKILSRGSLVMIYGGTIIYASATIMRGLLALIMQQEKVAELNMIKNYPNEVKGKTFQIIKWTAILYWIYVTLSAYLIYEPVINWIDGLLTNVFVLGSVDFSIGSILAFFITLWLSLLISKFIRFLLEDEILTHFEMPRGIPGAISMIVRLVLIVIGFVLAFGAAQIDMSNITIIFGALGVGIGFGLQNIFSNLVSGLILAFERPIQVGDTIQISTLNLMGEVKEIGIRASTVRTFDGAEVIVPNGNLISNEMINWTLSDHRRRQEIIVGVAYGTDTNKVLKILSELVPEQDNVLKNPAPFVIFLGFGESSLDFRVLFWTQFSNGMGTKSAVGIAIDEAFKKEGIEIPFPQRDLHLRSVSDSVNFQNEKKPVPKVAPRKKASGSTSEK